VTRGNDHVLGIGIDNRLGLLRSGSTPQQEYNAPAAIIAIFVIFVRLIPQNANDFIGKIFPAPLFVAVGLTPTNR